MATKDNKLVALGAGYLLQGSRAEIPWLEDFTWHEACAEPVQREITHHQICLTHPVLCIPIINCLDLDPPNPESYLV